VVGSAKRGHLHDVLNAQLVSRNSFGNMWARGYSEIYRAASAGAEPRRVVRDRMRGSLVQEGERDAEVPPHCPPD